MSKLTFLVVLSALVALSASQGFLPNCQQLEAVDKNKCAVCDSGFRLTTDRMCTAICLTPCQTCDPNDGQRCLTCVTNFPAYFISSGTCVPCMAGCYKCTSTSACIECGESFYRENNLQVCKNCIENCAACDGPTGCLICKSGFSKSTNTSGGVNTVTCVNGGLGLLLIILIVIIAICVCSCTCWICVIYVCAKATSTDDSVASYEVQPATVVVYEEQY